MRRKTAIRINQGLNGTIAHTLGTWRDRQLEASLQKLQEAANNNDMQPIWKYQRNIRMNTMHSQAIIKKKDGKECEGMKEMLERWEEWTKECFSKEHKDLAPRIIHIAEQEWGKNFLTAPTDIKEIRGNADLTKIMNDKPEIESWLNQEYSEQDIETELRNLALKKAHGNDGIPGEAYKATREWAVKPITKIMNLI